MADDFAANVVRHLLAARRPHGHWEGELSSSALSTATAVFTLSRHGDPAHTRLVAAGLRWLAEMQNPDGGWGDTTLSVSNLSTSALVWAALTLPEAVGQTDAVKRVESYLRTTAGSLEPAPFARAVADRYGKDRTFSVPILTILALAGRLGPDGWRHAPQTVVRAGRTTPSPVRVPPVAGGQLRPAGAQRHRPGAAPSPAELEPDRPPRPEGNR